MNEIVLCVAMLFGQSLQRPSSRPLNRETARDSIEQALGQLRVSDRLAKARRLFPGLRPSGQRDVWQAKPGRGCLLTISSTFPMRDASPIETMVLEQIASKISPECAAMRTRRGLGLESTLADIRRLYRSSVVAHEADGKTVFVQDNGPECISGKTDVLQSFSIYLSKSTATVTMVVLEASKASCLDYRANQ